MLTIADRVSDLIDFAIDLKGRVGLSTDEVRRIVNSVDPTHAERKARDVAGFDPDEWIVMWTFHDGSEMYTLDD